MMNTKVNSGYERLPSCITSCLFSPLRNQETKSEQPLPRWCACIFPFFFPPSFSSFIQNCLALLLLVCANSLSYGCHYATIRMMADIKHHCRWSYLSFSHTTSWKYEVKNKCMEVENKCIFEIFFHNKSSYKYKK